jgi:hypothetical protein
MGLVGGYLGYMFTQESGGVDKSGAWDVQGVVRWALAPERVRDAAEWDAVLAQWNKEGYKVGLMIRADQRVDELVYGGVRLSALYGDEPADLAGTYGTLAQCQWVAFGGSGTRESRIVMPNVVTFPVRIRITAGGPGPQVVPVASRHLKGSFGKSMPGIWALSQL